MSRENALRDFACSIQCQFETFGVEALLPNSMDLYSVWQLDSSCDIYTSRGLVEDVCIPHFMEKSSSCFFAGCSSQISLHG